MIATAKLVRTQPEPACFRRHGAAQYLAMSDSAFDRAVIAGHVPAPRRIGRMPVWPRADLDRWLALNCPSAAEFAEMIKDD
jgi:predicted DNA-binding transcriptional regulator AlpA